MLYEVTTPSDSSIVIQANNSKEAKVKTCKHFGFKQSDYWTGVTSMKAHKVNVDCLDVVYRPMSDDEILKKLTGNDVILYDEHHGTATRLRKATLESIKYFMDEYTTIIIL